MLLDDFSFCTSSAPALEQDRAEAERFLRALDPSAERWTFQVFDDDPERKDDRLARTITGTLDECWPTLVERNSERLGIFVTINKTEGTRRRTENVVGVRAVFADHDDPNRAPTESELQPHIVVDSSPGKSHRYWLVNDCPTDDFKPLQKAISQTLGTDPAVNDLPRVMRLPGFYNQKGKPHLVKVREIRDGAKYKTAQLRQAFKSQPKVETAANDSDAWSLSEVPGYIRALMLSGAVNDDLSAGRGIDSAETSAPADAELTADRCQRLGNMRKTRGAKQSEEEWKLSLNVLVLTEQGEAVCHDWSKGHDGYDPAECQAKIDAASEFGKPTRCETFRALDDGGCDGCQESVSTPLQLGRRVPETARAGFKLTPVGELLWRKEPPTEWAVSRYSPMDIIELVIGDPASGKSLAKLDQACCIALGMEWHGQRVKQGLVVYIAGEGHRGIRKRVMAWALHHDRLEEIRTAPLVVSECRADLTDTQSLEDVIDAIDSAVGCYGEPVMVVIDTLHKNFSGDENDSKEMGLFLNHCDVLRQRYGANISIVHHLGHGDKSRGRGSSALRADCDAELLMATKNDIFTLSCPAKMKDAPRPIDKHFRLKEIELPWEDVDGQTETSVVLVQLASKPITTAALTPTQQDALDNLRGCCADNGGPVNAQVWRDAFYQSRAGDKADTKRRAFNRAKDDLLKSGRVTGDGDLFQPRPDTGQDTDIAGHCPEP